MNAVLASFRLANSHLRLLIDAGRRVIKSVGARKLALEAIATGAHADQRNRQKGTALPTTSLLPPCQRISQESAMPSPEAEITCDNHLQYKMFLHNSH